MSDRSVTGVIVEKELELTLEDLCRMCGMDPARAIELVDQGVVDPIGRAPEQWRFRGVSIRRVRCAVRLERDLGVNTAGAALALDLLDEVQRLRARLALYDDP